MDGNFVLFYILKKILTSCLSDKKWNFENILLLMFQKKYFKRTSMISINKDLVSKRNGVTFTEASDNVFEWGIRSFIFYFWVWMMSSTLGTYVSPKKNVRKITSNSFFCVFEYFLFHQLIIDCRRFMFSQKDIFLRNVANWLLV